MIVQSQCRCGAPIELEVDGGLSRYLEYTCPACKTEWSIVARLTHEKPVPVYAVDLYYMGVVGGEPGAES
jgi:phage FluMu protein Com